MHNSITLGIVSWLWVLPAAAQDATPAKPPAAASSITAGLTAGLTTAMPVVRAGRPVQMELVVTVNGPAELPVAVLGGMDLQLSLDGRPGPQVGEPGTGTVPVVAGLQIRRALTLDLATVEGLPTDLSRLGVLWPSLDVSTVVRIVPDQRKLDFDALDYTATRVRFITSKGDLVIGLRPDKAPKHCENLVKLSAKGFYDATRFHRIMAGFMVQGGCPNTKVGATGSPGTGSPGYMVDAEFNDTKHVKGIVSMARSNDPNSAGSQFFLVHGTAPWLDNQYTAFGRIEEGLDVLDTIAGTPVTQSPSGEPSIPTEDVWLYAAVVEPVFK